MAKVNITIEVSNHGGGGNVLRPAYRSYSAQIEKGGVEQSPMIDITGIDAVSFVEKAIQDVIKSAIGNQEEPADVTITNAGLTAGAEQFLSDKFTSDELINSITFA